MENWQIVEDILNNNKVYSVSNGPIGKRSFSYDFTNEMDAKNQLRVLQRVN